MSHVSVENIQGHGQEVLGDAALDATVGGRPPCAGVSVGGVVLGFVLGAGGNSPYEQLERVWQDTNREFQV